MLRAARAIWPGSAHSVKKREAKQMAAACHHPAVPGWLTGAGSGSLNQMKSAEKKKAAALSRSVHFDWRGTRSWARETAARSLAAKAAVIDAKTTPGRKRSEREATL